jgi:4-hydroxythreonine-4-phosphate dehydrogenase
LVTAGDPSGIGPEVILKALRRPLRSRARLILLGDAMVFEYAARRIRLGRLPWPVVSRAEAALERADRILFVDLARAGRITPGRTSARSGAASLAYLQQACRVLRLGDAQGIVTAPITKRSIQRSDASFIGHTEYFSRAFARPNVVMVFASDRMRVVLLSRHVALRRVASLTRRDIRATLRVTIDGMRPFAGAKLRLAVLGLNPHAGEGGVFGDEERRLLAPALRSFRREAVIEGPFAADGFFADARKAASYCAVVCWYHDQGLIPFKMLARDRGCQVTLGLPFVRTSPDHGSALDIAGKGIADPGSMRYALELAARLVCTRRPSSSRS